MPNSSEINYQIYQLLKVRDVGRASIGVYRDKNKNFITTGGVSVSYTNWNKGEPNNSGGKEDCVEMYAVPGKAGRWNDLPCWGYSRRHVCEVVV